MNGVHDMGGMHGFGPVMPEPDEPVFHAPWEGRVLAMTRAMGYAGAFNIDVSRFYRESLPPDVYLASSYYRKWQLALENSLVARGYVGADEIAAGKALRPAEKAVGCILTPDSVDATLVRGSFGREPPAPAGFKAGDKVRMRNINPPTHTRLPRYVRGRVGTVERLQGCHVFPDSAGRDAGEDPQWLYTVVFDSRELWGPDADPSVTVSVEAFEPYLESV